VHTLSNSSSAAESGFSQTQGTTTSGPTRQTGSALSDFVHNGSGSSGKAPVK
jgi:hypothetical protein